MLPTPPPKLEKMVEVECTPALTGQVVRDISGAAGHKTHNRAYASQNSFVSLTVLGYFGEELSRFLQSLAAVTYLKRLLFRDSDLR